MNENQKIFLAESDGNFYLRLGPRRLLVGKFDCGGSWAAHVRKLINKSRKKGKNMDAVCSFCQKTILDGAEFFNDDKTFLVMKSHDNSNGEECEGTGTTTETVLPD